MARYQDELAVSFNVWQRLINELLGSWHMQFAHSCSASLSDGLWDSAYRSLRSSAPAACSCVTNSHKTACKSSVIGPSSGCCFRSTRSLCTFLILCMHHHGSRLRPAQGSPQSCRCRSQLLNSAWARRRHQQSGAVSCLHTQTSHTVSEARLIRPTQLHELLRTITLRAWMVLGYPSSCQLGGVVLGQPDARCADVAAAQAM